MTSIEGQETLRSLTTVLQNTEAAQACVKNVLTVLNEALATRTFLVGERVTLADIACVCNLLLLYKQVRSRGNRSKGIG